jgi:hypothetical protein
MTNRNSFLLIAFLVTLAGGATTSATAQGLSELHAQVRKGSKICFADHFHEGYGSGQRSRKAAERAAIRSWEDFTSLEYGAVWGSFRLAESRGSNCTKSAGGWSCSVQARACRRARR